MAQPLTKTGDILPNQTIYVNNINERIRKDELRKSLYALFSQFGPILDIVASKAFRMRGQAFIVFKDIASAAIAMRQMNGFMFYDKPLKVQYAKTKSDIVAKADGTYVPRPKDKKRKAEEQVKKAQQAKRQETIPAVSGAQPPSVTMPAASAAYPPPPPPSVTIMQPELPNKILFVQNLPENATTESVAQYFSQFPGFKEVRLVPTKKGLAFVEFETEMQATVAMTGLNNFRVDDTHAMVISYAKRG